jgi:hypothetical protein
MSAIKANFMVLCAREDSIDVAVPKKDRQCFTGSALPAEKFA